MKKSQKSKPTIYEEYFQLLRHYSQSFERCILLYQVGSFYEVYGVSVSNALKDTDPKNTIESFSHVCNLSIAVKSRHFWGEKGGDEGEDCTTAASAILMAGFRDFLLDKYVEKLVDAAYTVVVYKQEESGNKEKNRVLEGIYSPGTFFSQEKDRETNHVVSICVHVTPPSLKAAALFVCGISMVNSMTGKCQLFEYETPHSLHTMYDELDSFLASYAPNEVLFLGPAEAAAHVRAALGSRVLLHCLNDASKMARSEKQTYHESLIDRQWGDEFYATSPEFAAWPLATQSLCFLLDVLMEHNADILRRMVAPIFRNVEGHMVLANHTLRQLNIIDSSSAAAETATTGSSVLQMMNQCVTAMGRRRFKDQLLNPTYNVSWLQREYDMVTRCLNMDSNSKSTMVASLRKIMGGIGDLEKMARGWVLQKAPPRSFLALYDSLDRLQQIHRCLAEEKDIIDYVMQEYDVENGAQGFDDLVGSVAAFIESRVDLHSSRGDDDANTNTTKMSCDDGFFRDGAFPELGALRAELRDTVAGLQALVDFLNREIGAASTQQQQQQQKQQTYVQIHKTEKSGISLLITKARSKWLAAILKKHDTLCGIPSADFCLRASPGGNESMMILDGNWIRETDARISRLQERAQKMSRELYRAFVSSMEVEWLDAMECFAEYVARLDVLLNRAFIATKNNYSCPVLLTSEEKGSRVVSRGMRHPLIETILKQEVYVPNDLELSGTGALLFGINSSGKTSLLRSLGICVILAQSGNFVPCDAFEYVPYRAMYSRILGNDDLFRGLSSFAVEMSELKVILRMADEYSLVLADEISKGSEMESAMSITTATIQHLVARRSTFLITSHLHEIVGFDEIKGLVAAGSLRLCHLSVTYDAESDALVYDRVLKDGSGESFYGLLVCRSLHLPQSFIDAAYAVRAKLAHNKAAKGLGAPTSHYNAAKVRDMCEICKKEPAEETHHLAPQRAANAAGFIGAFHKNHAGNLAAVCAKCHDSIHSAADTAAIATTAEAEGTKKNTPVKQTVRKKTTRGYKIFME